MNKAFLIIISLFCTYSFGQCLQPNGIVDKIGIDMDYTTSPAATYVYFNFTGQSVKYGFKLKDDGGNQRYALLLSSQNNTAKVEVFHCSTQKSLATGISIILFDVLRQIP